MQYIFEAFAQFWQFLSTSEWIGLKRDKTTSVGKSPRAHRLRVEKAS